VNRYHNVEGVCSRVGIFVDVQNMYFSAQNAGVVSGKGKINYGKMLDFLANGNDVVVARTYLMIKEEVDTTKFRDMLYLNGYDLRIKNVELREREDGRKVNVSSWDVGMTVDMIQWASKVDTIILVSGNGVFCDALAYIKTMCRVEVAGFPNSTSGHLKKMADFFIDLSVDNGGLLTDKVDNKDILPDDEEEVEVTEEGGKVG
jgi:uncharacterized LabA/DUF88 family protein